MYRKLPTPAQEAAASTLRDRLLADRGGPEQAAEAETVLIDLIAMGAAMHNDAARYLGSLPRPWVDRRSNKSIRVVHDVRLQALPLFTARRCDLLDLPKLHAQLVGLERRRRAGGRDVVDHPPGAHDDVANVACGALVRAAAAATGAFEVLASNVAEVPRQRLIDVREFELLRRGLY